MRLVVASLLVILAVTRMSAAERPPGSLSADLPNVPVITVDEIVIALNFALDGCPPAPTPTATPNIQTVRVDVGTASGARGTTDAAARLRSSLPRRATC